jgi:acetoin utilization protein AcuC
MLGPPFVISDEECDLVVERTAAAIERSRATVSGDVASSAAPRRGSTTTASMHPLRPQRVLYTWSLIEACGLLELPHVSTRGCRPAADAELQLVHAAEFIDATRRAGHGEEDHWARFGYGPGDNPIFPNMHEAGALVAGASIVAAEAVAEGRARHAFNAAGGLHHAMPARASGFCVYDDPAIAIAWLLARGVHPIAYVDVDVHHGDGPQAIFYEDPRVLTISLHQSGDTLFPGTGFLTERGAAGAEGTKVNVPLQPGVSDEAWLTAFREIVPPIVTAFAPKVLVTQLGCDTHWSDPLANLL